MSGPANITHLRKYLELRRKYLELLVTGAELVLSDGNSAARALIVMVRI